MNQKKQLLCWIQRNKEYSRTLYLLSNPHNAQRLRKGIFQHQQGLVKLKKNK